MQITKNIWKKAQNTELTLWQKAASSLNGSLSRLLDNIELERFVQQQQEKIDLSFEKTLEIGIGSLGIGWVGLFANGLLIGIDSLPILHTETKREEFNEFITQLQKRVKFIRSYGEQLPFQDEIFNTVVCNNVIDHCQRPNLVVQEAYRVLKPQGYIILGVNCFSIIGLLKWRLYTTKRFAKSANVLAHPHNYLDKGVVKIIRKAGFEICAMNQVSMRKRVIGHQYRLYLIARK